MELEQRMKRLEDQVIDLFAENRKLIKQIQELAGLNQTPQQVYDIKALALRIHRDGWDAALGKQKRGGRHVKKTVA